MLTDEVIRTKVWACHCGGNISLRASIKRAVKDSTVSQRFLTDPAYLFSTPLLLVSLVEHSKAKAAVAGNNCGEETRFSTGLN
jgi:hypothetical protein